MADVILDTNFLLIPAKFRVDIFSEIDRLCAFPYRLCVLEGTLRELDNIVETQRGKDRDYAKIARLLVKQKSLYTFRNFPDGRVDDIIVSISGTETIVATQDQGLKRRLREKGVRIITLRNKNHLELI